MLNEHNVKTEYRSLIDNVVQDFMFRCFMTQSHIKELLGSFLQHRLLKFQRASQKWLDTAEKSRL